MAPRFHDAVPRTANTGQTSALGLASGSLNASGLQDAAGVLAGESEDLASALHGSAGAAGEESIDPVEFEERMERARAMAIIRGGNSRRHILEK